MIQLLLWLLLALVSPAQATICTDNQAGALTCAAGVAAGRLEVIQGAGQFTYVTPNDLEAYTCPGMAPPGENGPEAIYSFTCMHSTNVTVTLSNPFCNANLYVIEPCSARNCLDGSALPGTAPDTVSFACTAGTTYWIAVEGKALGLPFIRQCPGFIPVGGGGGVGGARTHYVVDYTISAQCQEICANGVDDNENSLTDCDDPACSTHPACCDRDRDGINARGACMGTDCNDLDATVRPNATDIPADGIDQDCDNVDSCYQDQDLDGWGSSRVVDGALVGCVAAGVSPLTGDCVDVGANAAQIHPEAPEVPADSVDQDCDGGDLCWLDNDGDGWGTALVPATGLNCAATAGFTDRGGDCLDEGVGSALVNPDGDEVCNGLDDDCNDLTDDEDPGVAPGADWFYDGDGDGFGVPSPTANACEPPPGYARTDNDCLDAGPGAALTYPGAEEIPVNGQDEDCDGRDHCYLDIDLDGFGGPTPVPGDNLVCGDVIGESTDGTDCMDMGVGAGAVHPGVPEICNGLDDDCDGLTDDADPERLGGAPWYVDADGDGFPGDGATVIACVPPPGGGAVPTDCDDRSAIAATVYPFAPEVAADGVDQDCDGVDHCWVDLDLDGYGGPAALPGAGLACGAVAGESSVNTDCLDDGPDAASVFPTAPELCNSVDDDCDLLIDDLDPDRADGTTWYFDTDGDGFAGDARTEVACLQPESGVPALTDCLDAGPTAVDVYPGAPEIPLDGLDQDCDGTDHCLLDLDLDGFGSAAVAAGDDLICGNAPGEAVTADDCLDTGPEAPAVFPGAAEVCNAIDDDCDLLIDDEDPGRQGGALWYLDNDSDGFPGAVLTLTACSQPVGSSALATDCLDAGPTAANVYPGAPELVADGIDQDCDAVDACPADLDLDGYGGPQTMAGNDLLCGNAQGEGVDRSDCLDSGRDAAAVFPGAPELCNGIDDDCDLLLDDQDPGVTGGAALYYFDLDGDGFAGDQQTSLGCTPPPGGRIVADDCRDVGPRAAEIYPGAPEAVADGVDQDCDGVDHCWLDRDGDGFGSTVPGPGDDLICGNDPSESPLGTDCLDVGELGPVVWPGAPEVCDGVDNDCDGAADDADSAVVGAPTWYVDGDNDGYAGPVAGARQCEAPPYQLALVQDCNDGSAAIHPTAPEICNALDDDCDALIDGDDVLASPVQGWADADLDGFGDAQTPLPLPGCEEVPGLVLNDGDCDDGDPAAAPGAPEVPYDGVDQDCDGADRDDLDQDGWRGGPSGDDCADEDPDVRPDTTERADGVDEDCDGLVDQGTAWFDDDGDGATEEGGDCDDADAGAAPGLAESCDGRDEDCDGAVDDGTPCYDDDGDGVTEDDGDCHDGEAEVRPGASDVPGSGVDGDCDGLITTSDNDADGYGLAGGDCDDTLATTRPGAIELVNGVDDDCDGAVDEGTPVRDDDFDGYSELSGDCDDTVALISPVSVEQPDNGRDDDCDGTVDEGGLQFDDDGDGYAEAGGDCDDSDPLVSPAGSETADGVDQDCDGAVDDGTSDLDQDGYATGDGDCDDGDGWVHPGLQETCDKRDNNCDGAIDEGCSAELPEGPVVEEDKAGCSCEVGGGAGWWLLALALAGRRRAASPLKRASPGPARVR